MTRRILYLQYTDAAAYPPLHHSSRILAHSGWQVFFFGTASAVGDSLKLPTDPGIHERKLSFCGGGWQQKLHYLWFTICAFFWTICWRPKWIYASDPLSTPVALLLRYLPGIAVVYHEHDSPARPPIRPSAFQKLVTRTRSALAKRADLCVLPNEGRAQQFRNGLGTSRPTLAVWNCPAADEALYSSSRNGAHELGLYYHGNLSPGLLPLTLIDALAQTPYLVRLTAIGYKTLGNEDYDRVLLDRAASLGLQDRVAILPPLARSDLLQRARQFDVGWAALPVGGDDINFRHMVGASNKAFDYLASGLALLVSDDAAWKSAFVEQGYALSCDAGNPASIAKSLTWFCEHRPELRKMGEQGRQRIIDEWNYEKQFMPVLDVMNASSDNIRN